MVRCADDAPRHAIEMARCPRSEINPIPLAPTQTRHVMSLQILSLKLDGITAGDYLTWCRDPDPPALDYGLRSIRVDAYPFGDTITATLNWNQPAPAPAAAATAAGLPLLPGVQLHALALTGAPDSHGDQGFAGGSTARTWDRSLP
jgi:hypothetical protein